MTTAERSAMFDYIKHHKTLLEIFSAGFNAGCDHLQPGVGPGAAAPRDAAEGLEMWMEDEFLRLKYRRK